MMRAKPGTICFAPGSPRPALVDARLNGIGPLWRIYDAAGGGFVLVAVKNDAEWLQLVAAIGRDDLAADPRFATGAAREANAAALADLLGAALATRSAAEWEQEGLRRRIGLVQVSDLPCHAAILDTGFAEEHDLIVDIVDPTWGPLPRQAPHVRLSRSATQAKPAVLAGQHTDEVLRKAGMADRIGELREAGVVS